MKLSEVICSGIAIVLTCVGAVWFFFGLIFRMDPGEELATLGIDVCIGLALAGACFFWGRAFSAGTARARPKRFPTALVVSALVGLVATSVLFSCQMSSWYLRRQAFQQYLAAKGLPDDGQSSEQAPTPIVEDRSPPVAAVPIVPEPKTEGQLLADAAMGQVGKTTKYDPAYVGLDYPGGDVPIDRGVCTDVVVRALRKLGVDLQVLIHEDMTASFKSYPDLWGLKRPDRNIDHRRVPNIARYLHRKGKAVPVTQDPKDYLPGDIVVWRLSDGRLHMGIVSDTLVAGTRRRMIVHNMGAGAKREDRLFSFKITEHFRYF